MSDLIHISKEHYQDIYNALTWMITALDYSKKNTGLNTEDSPEMQKVKQVRDKVRSGYKHDMFCTAPAGGPCTCGQDHKLITKPLKTEDTPLRKIQ